MGAALTVTRTEHSVTELRAIAGKCRELVIQPARKSL